MPNVWVLQHIRCESLGSLANVLKAANIQPDYVRTFEGCPVPTEMGDAAGLIVMGGPMGVNEHYRYPFLRQEMRLIEQALKEEKPVLGVCLGSQLLAAVLGATVTPGKRKEIGWYPITATLSGRQDPLWKGIESPLVAFHWHGDVFNLPRGAVSLASSEMTTCQAFRYGALAYGFLFHMEVTRAIIKDMVTTFAAELVAAGLDSSTLADHAEDYLPRLQMVGQVVFVRWTSLQRVTNA